MITRKPSRRAIRERKSGVVFRVLSDGREICTKTKAGVEEYQSRIAEMACRQGWICPLCGNPLAWGVTFEHEAGKGMGNCRQDDRITYPSGRWRNAAAHNACNIRKGSKRFAWIDGKYQAVQKYVQELA